MANGRVDNDMLAPVHRASTLPVEVYPRHGPQNTGDKLRSSIMLGFVSFNSLFDGGAPMAVSEPNPLQLADRGGNLRNAPQPFVEVSVGAIRAPAPILPLYPRAASRFAR